MIVGLYAIYLFTIAIQTAEGLEGITAFISAISPFILLFIALICLSSLLPV